jgi:hypothetical protein
MGWKGYVACIVEMRNAYNIFVRRPERKRPLERIRRRWEDIRMDVREIVWEVVDGIYLAQYRDQCQALANTIMNFPVP